MKIYLLEQSQNAGWDTYDSCVVVAENKDDAKNIMPNGEPFKGFCDYNDWADEKEKIEVTEIGEANDYQRRGVICASFNAG